MSIFFLLNAYRTTNITLTMQCRNKINAYVKFKGWHVFALLMSRLLIIIITLEVNQYLKPIPTKFHIGTTQFKPNGIDKCQ